MTIGFLGGKFLPFHLGHMYMALEAANKVDKLYVVLSSSKNRDRELCERDGIKYIPAETRLSWLGEAFANLENIKVMHIEDDQWDSNYDWEAGAKAIKKAIGKPIDFVFSSEDSYNEHFRKYYPESEHVIIDEKRETVTVSATELRKNLYKNWDKLPSAVRGFFTKRVAVVGTESCGKSTLAKQLAKFYNTNFVHEVGRDYCERHANQLTPDMFDNIAMEHFLLQEKMARDSNKILFVDSDAVITQYYLDMYFHKKSSLVDEIAKKQKFDLVLFLEPDVKWVSDGLRFAGQEEQRTKNNEKLKQMYKEKGIEFICISGNYSERFTKARNLVNKLFEVKNEINK
jgi:HTH-type transcriptional repressor of NAD biosynthesis genes